MIFLFTASDMALLAEEVCGSRVQRLAGGMIGDNTALILKHLTDGQPILIPYPNPHMPSDWWKKKNLNPPPNDQLRPA